MGASHADCYGRNPSHSTVPRGIVRANCAGAGLLTDGFGRVGLTPVAPAFARRTPHWLGGATCRSQWRDRAGFSPDFPVRPSWAPRSAHSLSKGAHSAPGQALASTGKHWQAAIFKLSNWQIQWARIVLMAVSGSANRSVAGSAGTPLCGVRTAAVRWGSHGMELSRLGEFLPPGGRTDSRAWLRLRRVQRRFGSRLTSRFSSSSPSGRYRSSCLRARSSSRHTVREVRSASSTCSIRLRFPCVCQLRLERTFWLGLPATILSRMGPTVEIEDVGRATLRSIPSTRP